MREKLTKINWNLKEHMQSAAFLAPSFVGVMLFYIIPFVVVIFYAFVNSPIAKTFTGLKNFANLLGNASFINAAKNTATFSAVAVPLAVILALGLAILLEQKVPFKSQFRTIFLCPMMVPVASIVLIWQVIFHYNGVLNEFFGLFGADKIDWLKSGYSQIVIVVLFLWKNLGYNMILFMAALSNIPKDLIEVARIEGASSFGVFFMVKLRYLSPTILFVTILSLINSFKVFREVYLLTGDHPYGGLYLLQHFMNNMFSNLDYQKLSAAAIVMAIVMIILIAIMFAIENWYGKDVEG